MPRKEVDPLIKTLQAFETAPLEKAEFALQIASETIRRRRTQAEAVIPVRPAGKAPAKRKLQTPPRSTAKPLAKPRTADPVDNPGQTGSAPAQG